MQRDDFEVRTFPSLASVGHNSTEARLRVVIATEEILGPVRNGGIASTYYHLARGLAAQGHEVHVLFLKGPVVQDETPEYWVQHYSEFGVRLHYLEMGDAPLWGAAAAWQRRYAAAYDWLRDQQPFDVVHTTEWRGGLIYALMAKRLGLAFRDTLFLVKTSSPYIWNRHYQMHPINQRELVAASYAEQKCVELGDVVIGGSAHLISFMDHIGYQLPAENVFVQPNVVDFSNVVVQDSRPGGRRTPGELVNTRDLVFFGRLEARKGLHLFCSAIDVLHERGEIPRSVTFLGKWGAGLSTHNGIAPETYVTEKSERWECPVRVVTDRNQPEALSLMCETDVVAVMPSIIENSTMAVYEALEHGIPFVATAVGGTPELIDEADLEACLVEPTPRALADRLESVLRSGHRVARARFSNDENLKVWYGFHRRLAELARADTDSGGLRTLASKVDSPGDPVQSVSFVALVREGEPVEDLIKALHEEPPDEIVLGYTDAAVRLSLERARVLLAEKDIPVSLVHGVGMNSGTALNVLVQSQSCEATTVAHGIGALPRPGYFDAVRHALTTRPGALFTTFFATEDLTMGMPLGGDIASQVLTSRAYGPECVALRADTFSTVGSFEPYDVRQGLVHEYVTRACTTGHDLMVFPEQLMLWRSVVEDTASLQTDPIYTYLKAKPLIDGSDLELRRLLLAALHQGSGMNGVDEKHLWGATDTASAMHWLMPATWDPENVDRHRERRLIVGLDPHGSTLWLYARGPGNRLLTVRGEPVRAELIVSHGEANDEEYMTLSSFHVPPAWSSGTSYPLLWGLYEGEEKIRNLFLRINKIGPSTHSCAGLNVVLSSTALRQLFNQRASVSWESVPGATLPVSDPPQTPPAIDTPVTTPLDQPEPTDHYVSRAVAAAQHYLQHRRQRDPGHAILRSRELLLDPPAVGLLPISPGSGLKAPHRANGWSVGEWLEGWAWDREHRERELHVALVGEQGPLLLVDANSFDGSLSVDVPGRGRHAYRIPVLPQFFEADHLRLEIWEGQIPVHRGRLYVDRNSDRPMLLRARHFRPPEAQHRLAARRRRGWWRRP